MEVYRLVNRRGCHIFWTISSQTRAKFTTLHADRTLQNYLLFLQKAPNVIIIIIISSSSSSSSSSSCCCCCCCIHFTLKWVLLVGSGNLQYTSTHITQHNATHKTNRLTKPHEQWMTQYSPRIQLRERRNKIYSYFCYMSSGPMDVETPTLSGRSIVRFEVFAAVTMNNIVSN
jgi:hypothetical protein